MHAASADRVIHTCYCYGSFSLLFKLVNLTRFILEIIRNICMRVVLKLVLILFKFTSKVSDSSDKVY